MRLMSDKKFFKLFLILATTTTILFFYGPTFFVNHSDEKDEDSILITANDKTLPIKIVNLNEPLEPKILYDGIDCRKSATILSTTCTLCVHKISNDIYVSNAIWNDGIWEANIVANFMEYVTSCTDCLVFDIGAHVGQYSLFAAAAGRKVVTIEPFYDNMIRIHKASKIDGTDNNILLIGNGLSNKRNEIKLLHHDNKNVGGQSLMGNEEKVFKKEDLKTHPNAKYLVQTIIWDDIVPYLPLNEQNEKFKRAIIKMDIELYEPYAFQNATKFFDTLDVLVIFMEWGFKSQKSLYPLVENMLDFLYSRDFVPHGESGVLERDDWKRNWATDIIWKKKTV